MPPEMRFSLRVPSGRARTQAFNLHNEFVTDFIGSFEDVGTIRVADDLDQAFTIAQIDENNTAVVAAAMGPAVEVTDLIRRNFSVNQICIFSTALKTPKSRHIFVLYQ